MYTLNPEMVNSEIRRPNIESRCAAGDDLSLAEELFIVFPSWHRETPRAKQGTTDSRIGRLTRCRILRSTKEGCPMICASKTIGHSVLIRSIWQGMPNALSIPRGNLVCNRPPTGIQLG